MDKKWRVEGSHPIGDVPGQKSCIDLLVQSTRHRTLIRERQGTWFGVKKEYPVVGLAVGTKT